MRYTTRVIDGMPAQGGACWPHMSRTVCATSIGEVLDAIEREVMRDHVRSTLDEDDKTVTILAWSDDCSQTAHRFLTIEPAAVLVAIREAAGACFACCGPRPSTASS